MVDKTVHFQQEKPKLKYDIFLIPLKNGIYSCNMNKLKLPEICGLL